jgi:hypothetical protein
MSARDLSDSDKTQCLVSFIVHGHTTHFIRKNFCVYVKTKVCG